MKIFIIPVLLLLTSCGPESSPDGRSRLRDEKIQVEIDSLKYQNQTILHTIDKINEEIRMLKNKR